MLLVITWAQLILCNTHVKRPPSGSVHDVKVSRGREKTSQSHHHKLQSVKKQTHKWDQHVVNTENLCFTSFTTISFTNSWKQC